MIESAKLEDAVTGQCDVLCGVRSNFFPSAVVLSEFLDTSKSGLRGPNEVRNDLRPKRYRQSIELSVRNQPRQAKTLNGDNLKCKTSRRIGTHIKLERTYAGHLSFVIGR